MADPEVMRHLGPAFSGEEAWRRIVASTGMWAVCGFGGWVVEHKADRRLIGQVGLFNLYRELEPAFGETPEMGWIFDPSVHGQGIAREACDAALDWADATLAEPIWAIIDPDNQPSLKLAARLGFERVADSVYHEEAIVVLKRPVRD